jgi:hypothetical protein
MNSMAGGYWEFWLPEKTLVVKNFPLYPTDTTRNEGKKWTPDPCPTPTPKHKKNTHQNLIDISCILSLWGPIKNSAVVGIDSLTPYCRLVFSCHMDATTTES